MDLLDLDWRALRATGEIVGMVAGQQLDWPTPCPKWTVRELLRHLVGENRGFAAAAATGVAPDRSVWTTGEVGSDPYGAYKASAEAVTSAFATAVANGYQVEVREFGVFSARTAVSMHFVDYLVHGWDVARAIGAPSELDEELASAAFTIALRWPYNRPDGAFEERVPVPAEAPTYQRLVAYLGRSPNWPDR